MNRTRVGSLPGSPAGLSVAALVLVAFLGLPVVVLLVRAVVGEDALGRFLNDPAILAALGVSVMTTSISLGLTVLLGTPLAYALATRSMPASRLVETIVDLPIVLPPSVAGLALLLLLGRRGPLGGMLDQAGVELAFTTTAVVLAQVFVSAPLFVRSARIGFRAVGRDVIEAARVDGAGNMAVFARVMLPLATPALASGAILAWVRALGEFGATIIFAGNIEGRTQTLPLLVYSSLQTSLGAAIATAAVLVVVALALLLAVRSVRGRDAVMGLDAG
jgi:molybdate transport system permease protein